MNWFEAIALFLSIVEVGDYVRLVRVDPRRASPFLAALAITLLVASLTGTLG